MEYRGTAELEDTAEQDSSARDLTPGTTTQLRPCDLAPIQPRSGMSGKYVKRLAGEMKREGYPEGHCAEVFPWEGIVYVVNGHHHHAAALRAGVETMPVRVLSEEELGNYSLTPHELTVMSTERLLT